MTTGTGILETVGLRRRVAHPQAVSPGVVRRLAKRREAQVGALMLALLVLFLALAPLLSGADPYAEDGAQLEAPSAAHLLGTDQVGRDELVRVALGGRRSLLGALAALALAVAIGLVLGIGAAMSHRRVDGVAMRIVDAMNGIPPLIVPIAIVGVLGTSFTNLLLAIVIGYAPSYVRIARTYAESVRHRLDVVSARMLGVPRVRVARTHVLPAVATQMLVIATLDVGSVVIALSSLSFLGLGAQAPTPEWGVLLNDGQLFFQVAPWLLLAPAVAITVVVLGFNLIGEALRDAIAEESGT